MIARMYDDDFLQDENGYIMKVIWEFLKYWLIWDHDYD